MTREEIKGILPHREPMLLVDTAEVTGEGTARGTYQVRGDEFFLQGHFPGNPVVPGVILCEIMAQTAAVLLADTAKGMTPYFTSLDKVRFKDTVKPGDLLEIEVAIVKNKGPFYFAEGKASVGGKLKVKGEFSFALIKGEK